MGANLIQAEYEQLDAVAARFGQRAEATNEMLRVLEQRSAVLIAGAWQGRGLQAFTTEMESAVLPAVRRLGDALSEGQRATVQINQLMRAAEEEAAEPFKSGESRQLPLENGSGLDSGDTHAATPTPPANNAPGFFRHFDLKGDGDILKFDFSEKSGSRRKFDPGLDVKYGVDGAVFGSPEGDGFSAVGGETGVQFGMGEDGFTAGAYGEVYAAQGQVDGVLLGDNELGWTAGVTGNALAADGFVGVRDNSFGAKIGATLVSVEGETGLNVAGYNISLTGEAGLKAEWGFKIGAENELDLPFISFGFKVGKAVE